MWLKHLKIGRKNDDGETDSVSWFWAYINGYADVEHTLRQLVYHKPNYQICILNQEVVEKFIQYQSYKKL